MNDTRNPITNTFAPTHGMSYTPEYKAWISMRERCCVESNPSYESYGGRGITICSEWMDSFESFHSDMGDKPSKTHSLDRIDNELGYYPENCKWSTKVEQASNRSSSVVITYKGETNTIAEWGRIVGMYPSAIRRRLKRGLSAEDILTTPSRSKQRNGVGINIDNLKTLNLTTKAA